MDFVLSKETLKTKESIYDGSVQQPIDCDITLPEYCPDILRILKCQLTPRISSHNFNTDRLNIDGSAILRILYIDENNATVNSYEQICQFSKTIDVSNISSNAIITLDAETEYVNCRAINQRRVDINGSVIIKINISDVKEKHILSSAGGKGIQIKTEKVESLTIKGFAQKTITVDETLELGRSDYAVAQLIRYDGDVILNDVKIITNKLLIKGDLVLKLLYTADDKSGRIESLTHALPISQIIDVDGIDDTDKCKVNLKLSSLSLSLRSDSNGELRQADVVAKISVTALSAQNISFQVIKEAYSTKCNLETERQLMEFVSVADNVSDVFLIRDSLDVTSVGVSNVIDLWSNGITSNARVEGSKLILNGSLALAILVTDTSNQAAYLERQVEFESTYDVNVNHTFSKCSVDVGINAIDYIAHGSDKIDVKIELRIDASAYKLYHEDIIVKLEPDESEKHLNAPCALTVYFCDENESVWDIARRYNTTVAAIMEENELESEVIDRPRMLMIPGI
ncbi:MAG: DUF3794 domain-containing protein [Clostridia bacterium]|nr:DUF3794 domain-containing protein [Clostridia bacterium]